MNNRTIKAAIKALEKKAAALAKTRDELRDLEDEIMGLREVSEDAFDSLTYAIERLSELV